MIPGYTTKLSEQLVALSTSIDAKADMLRVTSTAVTTVLATILPNFGGGFSGVIFLVNDSGAAIQLATTGNINRAVTAIADDVMTVLTFSKLSGKWYPGAIS